MKTPIVLITLMNLPRARLRNLEREKIHTVGIFSIEHFLCLEKQNRARQNGEENDENQEY